MDRGEKFCEEFMICFGEGSLRNAVREYLVHYQATQWRGFWRAVLSA